MIMKEDFNTILSFLKQNRLDYRHAYGILDPEYKDWRRNKADIELINCGQTLLIFDCSDDVITLLGDLQPIDIPLLYRILEDHQVNELDVLGDCMFGLLEYNVGQGNWRMSRNYAISPGIYRQHSKSSARFLSSDDTTLFFESILKYPELDSSNRSASRDFNYMVTGLPVLCVGVIIDNEMVGFCSANPICSGVTEISWISVAQTWRRKGLASKMLSAQIEQAFIAENLVTYHAGSAGEDLDKMLTLLGFQEIMKQYRFIPLHAVQQWRTLWGKVPSSI